MSGSACRLALSLAAVACVGAKAAEKPSSVQLTVPAQAPSSGPIPIAVRLDANARTYWDTNGILDQALHVVLVRTDAPGVLFVAKEDPSAMMAPSAPLPGRPSEAALSKKTDRVSEEKSYDVLAYDRQHPGSARYQVLACFAQSCAGPHSLQVQDAKTVLPGDPTWEALPMLPASPGPAPPKPTGVVIQVRGEQLEGSFRVPAGERDGEALLTVLVARTASTGGVFVVQRRLPARREGKLSVGAFLLPLSALKPALATGPHRVYAFIGDTTSAPASLQR